MCSCVNARYRCFGCGLCSDIHTRDLQSDTLLCVHERIPSPRFLSSFPLPLLVGTMRQAQSNRASLGGVSQRLQHLRWLQGLRNTRERTRAYLPGRYAIGFSRRVPALNTTFPLSAPSIALSALVRRRKSSCSSRKDLDRCQFR